MDYKEEQNGEIEALLSIYEGELDGNLKKKLHTLFITLKTLNHAVVSP